MRTVTFWSSVTAVRMKSGERQTPVRGMLVPLQVRGIFSIMNEHNLSIIARLAWNNSNSMEEFQNRIIIQCLSITESSLERGIAML